MLCFALLSGKDAVLCCAVMFVTPPPSLSLSLYLPPSLLVCVCVCLPLIYPMHHSERPAPLPLLSRGVSEQGAVRMLRHQNVSEGVSVVLSVCVCVCVDCGD